MNQGLSRDELQQIGERKLNLRLPMSATDINAAVPYEVARAAMHNMQGFTEDQLKDVGMRKGISCAPLNATQINEPAVKAESWMEKTLDNLNSFLQFKVK